MSEAGLLEGRAALITGGNRGLGLEIARTYLSEGADVFICARDGARLSAAADQLKAEFPGRSIVTMSGDIGDVTDAGRLAAAATEAFPDLDILVNNAGVYGPLGLIEDVDWEEWIAAIRINLLGSVLMMRAVIPHFKARGYGKIVQLSGGGATNPMPRASAYAASKAAIVRMVETVAEEVRDHNIDVNSIAPGALNTGMLDEVLEAGPEVVGQAFYDRSIKQKETGGAGLERGAALALFLASRASDGITGRLISALWDAYDLWPERLEELKASDAYTLRRIVGRDRGLDWGDR